MMHKTMRAFRCLCILGSAVTWFATPCRAQDAAKIVDALAFSIKGQVTAQPEILTEASLLTKTVKKPPADEELLRSGGRLNTGSDGAASVILGTAGTARMGSDTDLLIPGEQTKSHSLEMLKGRLFLNISAADLKRRKTGEFKLKTPAALLAVKGTRFFTISQQGTDTIGVHEGSVTVTEPVSKTTTNITAGQAVIVSQGQISPPRPFTEAERDHTKEYDLANVVRTPLSLVVENSIPGAAKQPDKPSAKVFRNRQLISLPPAAYADFKEQPGCLAWPARAHNPRMGDPQLTSSGALVYSWSFAVTYEEAAKHAAYLQPYSYHLRDEGDLGPVAQTEYDLWMRDKKGVFILGPVIAVQFLMRSKNVSHFVLRTRTGDRKMLGTVFTPPALASNDGLKQVMVQASPWKDSAPPSLGLNFLMIEPFHNGPDKAGAPARRGAATLEISEIVLLSLPKWPGGGLATILIATPSAPCHEQHC